MAQEPGRMCVRNENHREGTHLGFKYTPVTTQLNIIILNLNLHHILWLAKHWPMVLHTLFVYPTTIYILLIEYQVGSGPRQSGNCGQAGPL